MIYVKYVSLPKKQFSFRPPIFWLYMPTLCYHMKGKYLDPRHSPDKRQKDMLIWSSHFINLLPCHLHTQCAQNKQLPSFQNTNRHFISNWIYVHIILYSWKYQIILPSIYITIRKHIYLSACSNLNKTCSKAFDLPNVNTFFYSCKGNFQFRAKRIPLILFSSYHKHQRSQ